MDQKICYCFDHTEADIREDVQEHGGVSEIMRKIMTAKKGGTCQCSVNHPKGR